MYRVDEPLDSFRFQVRGQDALATAGGTPALLWCGFGCGWFLDCRLGSWLGCGSRRGLGRGSALGDDDVNDFDRAIGAVVGIAAHARNLLYQGDAGIVALTEEGVSAIQAGVGNFGDEKLRAVGAGTGVGVGHPSGAVELQGWGGFVLEFKTNISIAAAGGIAALNHEVRNYAVEDGAVIERDTVLLGVRDG